MASPSTSPKAPSPPPPGHMPSKTERRMSHFKEYKFFRSFSAKIENWPMRKAEQLWRKMRERKIAEMGVLGVMAHFMDKHKPFSKSSSVIK
ncbi:unnamed protein product [Euphydryas editha]|uniref:Uncharacterized protein n=1 Tax=Euphydryas editha TaxID=104508 RepID=A0AAU9UBG6_EUPED|nr:unnamed protein product [Euphydryas editha]